MTTAEFSPHDVASLLLLLDVSLTGSITAAAAEHRMTTSAASQRLTKLERRCGQPLVIRSSRGVTLTDAGEALCGHARAIRHELRAAQGSLDSFLTLEAGRVRLGSFPTASASLVSAVLLHFSRRRPDVQISVHSALRDELVEMLEAGELDMTALWSYQAGADLAADISWSVLGNDPTVMLASARREASGPVRLDDLAGESWLVRTADHPATDVLRNACRRAGFEPRIVYEAHDYGEMQAMAAAGFGVALVPRLSMSHHRDDVRTVALQPDDRIPQRTIVLATHARRADSPTMAALRQVFSQRARRMLDDAR